MGLKPTKKHWKEAEVEEPLRILNAGCVETLLPLMVCDDEDGDEIITVAVHHRGLMGDNGITELRVILPGLCGHYGCGATSTISLN